MPLLNEDEYAEYKAYKENKAAQARLADDVTRFLFAAARCGFSDANQKDAIIAALGLMTGHDNKQMALLMQLPIVGKQRNG